MLTDSSTTLNTATEAIDADQSMVKISIVIVSTILLSAVTSYFFANGFLLWGLISLVLLSAMFVLQNFFVKGFDKLLVAALLESAAAAVFFYADFSGMVVIIVVAMIAMLSKSFFDVRRELETSLKVRFWKISKISLSGNVPALLLFFLALLSVRGSFFTEENFTKFILQPASPIVGAYLHDFDPNKNTREFIISTVVNSFTDSNKVAFKKLPPGVQSEYIEPYVDQFVSNIEKSTESEVDPNKPISTNIYNAIMSAYNKLTGNSRLLAIIIGVISVYYLIRSVMPILYLPIAFIVFIFYEILIASGFAFVQLESRSREVIVLK